MKKQVILYGVILLLVNCTKKQQSAKQENSTNPKSSAIADTVMTIAFRGIIKSTTDSLGVGTLVLKTKMGANKGTFTYNVDFGRNNVMFNGEKITSITDSGYYDTDISNDYGDVYVMNGGLKNTIPKHYYFKPMDNVLIGIDEEKNNYSGTILTEIIAKDTVQSRYEVLKALQKEQKLPDQK